MVDNNALTKIKTEYIKCKKSKSLALNTISVGKTSVISRLKGKQFENSTLSTAGIDYYIDEKTFDGIKYIIPEKKQDIYVVAM